VNARTPGLHGKVRIQARRGRVGIKFGEEGKQAKKREEQEEEGGLVEEQERKKMNCPNRGQRAFNYA